MLNSNRRCFPPENWPNRFGPSFDLTNRKDPFVLCSPDQFLLKWFFFHLGQRKSRVFPWGFCFSFDFSKINHVWKKIFQNFQNRKSKFYLKTFYENFKIWLKIKFKKIFISSFDSFPPPPYASTWRLVINHSIIAIRTKKTFILVPFCLTG